jgi:hypothetical protein
VEFICQLALISIKIVGIVVNNGSRRTVNGVLDDAVKTHRDQVDVLIGGGQRSDPERGIKPKISPTMKRMPPTGPCMPLQIETRLEKKRQNQEKTAQFKDGDEAETK